jgi:c-di-GMP-binding flagellar brake protein YcgR
VGNIEQGVEKRAYPRAAIELDGTYKVTGSVNGVHTPISLHTTPTKTRNISLGGAAFLSAHDLESGDLLKLEMQVPGQKDPVITLAEVKWKQCLDSGKGTGVCGVQFVILDDRDARVFETLIKDGKPA